MFEELKNVVTQACQPVDAVEEQCRSEMSRKQKEKTDQL
jgi:hypothetical protein